MEDMQDEGVNPELFELVMQRLRVKQGFAPPEPPPPPPGQPTPDQFGAAAAPPPGAGGAPAPGGMPPPPGGPAPMDPAMMAGGAAPTAPPGAQQAPQPMPQMGMAGPAAPQKVKPEQWMQALDFRLYNIQQQLTAIMNHQGVTLAPDALILPPGTPAAPPPEAAIQGGQMDPGPSQQAPGQGAISPIEPMEGAAPVDPAAAAGGAPPVKTAAEFARDLGHHLDPARQSPSFIGTPFAATPGEDDSTDRASNQVNQKVAALTDIFRRAAARDANAS